MRKRNASAVATAASSIAATSSSHAMAGALVQLRPGWFRMNVHVKPGARTTTIATPMPLSMTDGGPLEVRVAAQPEGGKANKELVDYLEEVFTQASTSSVTHTPRVRVDVMVTHGMTNRSKVIEVVVAPPDHGTVSAQILWNALAEECKTK